MASQLAVVGRTATESKGLQVKKLNKEAMFLRGKHNRFQLEEPGSHEWFVIVGQVFNLDWSEGNIGTIAELSSARRKLQLRFHISTHHSSDLNLWLSESDPTTSRHEEPPLGFLFIPPE